jgi:hypothetical protein
MTTRRPAALAAATISILIAACGGPSASTLSDPTAILQAAATQASTATAVHVDVTADGQLAVDLMGTGSAQPIPLAGTTASLDVDIDDAAVQGTFALPGILGLRGDVVVVDGTAYVKTSLTGAQYQAMPLDQAGVPDDLPSPDPSAMAEMLDGLADALAQPGVDPVKGDDVPCGSKTCYTVTIELTPEELAALESAAGGAVPLPSGLPVPVPDMGDASLDLTFRVETDTNRLAGLTAVVGAGDLGEATIEVTLSKWDEQPTITAPPADQVQGGG